MTSDQVADSSLIDLDYRHTPTGTGWQLKCCPFNFCDLRWNTHDPQSLPLLCWTSEGWFQRLGYDSSAPLGIHANTAPERFDRPLLWFL